MNAPLSVVMPTLDAADRIGPTLAALGEGLHEGLIRELVISDGGSRDEIAAVADALGARFVSGPASRGGQLRRGVAASSGRWVLALHADTVLAPGWSGVVRRHIQSTASGAGHERAGYFRLAFDDPSSAARGVAAWANARSRWLALPFGDQGLILSRALYDLVGGFPDQPLMEDVAIVRALGRRRLVGLDAVATTSAERYRREGWVRRGLRNWGCLLRYAAGADPTALAARYRGGAARGDER